MKAHIHKEAESVIVSFNPTESLETALLVVGKKHPKKDVEIVNAIQGIEAERLWKQLTSDKKG